MVWNNKLDPGRPQMAEQYGEWALLAGYLKLLDTLTIFNIYCFSLAKMVSWTRVNVTFMHTLPVLFIFALPTVSMWLWPSHVTWSPSRTVPVANLRPLRHVLEVTVYPDTPRANTGIETRPPFPWQNRSIVSSYYRLQRTWLPGEVLTWPLVTHSQISRLSTRVTHCTIDRQTHLRAAVRYRCSCTISRYFQHYVVIAAPFYCINMHHS
jgi:hypothetical protein